MRKLLTIPIIASTVLTAAVLSGHGQEPPTSQDHPALQRALAESPEADKDANSILSHEEYLELLSHERPHDPENPKAPLLPVRPNGDLVIHDFEANNIMEAPKWSPVRNNPLKDHPQGWHMGGSWSRSGTAFNRDLPSGTRLMKRRVGPFEGKLFVTTVSTSENEVGHLRSAVFLIEQDYILLSMSGGAIPGRICVNLHLKDGIVRSATGGNDDYFEKVALDVREFRGQLAKIELLDNHRGIWGHLNVDEILMSAQPGDARVVNQRPAPLATLGGVAITAAARSEGSLVVANDKLTSADVALDDELLLAINPRAEAPAPHPGAVHLMNGEVWQAAVGNITGKELDLNGKYFGNRKVPLRQIASMEFVAGAPDDPREPGHLYRSDGEAIPGKIIWVRAKDIAIKCPLGIIPIPRASVQRFVYAKPAPPAERTSDELGLMDGTLLFGKASFAGNQLVLAHDALGELKIDWPAVRYLRRNRPGLTWLDTRERIVVESIGPALPPPAPQLIKSDSDSHLRALRVMPHTVMRIPLPSSQKPGVFRAQLTPVPGNQATLKVSVLSGENTVWSQQVAADSKAIPLSINLSSATDLTIKVEFAGPLSFPCGIDLHDPHVLVDNNHGTEPLPK